MKRQEGFTLVEVIVVLIIISIMAAISTTSFVQWMPGMHLKSAAREVVGILQEARLEAVKRNTCVGVEFNPVGEGNIGGSYRMFVDDGGAAATCNRSYDAGEEVLKTIPVVDDLTLVSINMTAAETVICFNSRSLTCSSRSGNVQLKNNLNKGEASDKWFKATVTASGGLKLEQRHGKTAPWSY